jgi:putative component of toxin-antitoxin plasmid stabilization module
MSDVVEVVHSSWYNADLETLADIYRERVERRIDVFVDKGWASSVRDRTVVPLRDGIYELRVLGKGAAFRVLFFLVPGHSPRVVVLTACVAKAKLKKRQRLDAELERAIHRRTVWQEQQRKAKQDAGR